MSSRVGEHADPTPIEVGQLVSFTACSRDRSHAPPDDAVEILIQRTRSGAPRVFLSLAMSPVNESSRLARARSAERRAAALRSPKRRSRRRGDAPSDGTESSATTMKAILIDACVTVVAHTGERIQIHRELERGQLRLAAICLAGSGSTVVPRKYPSSRCVWSSPRSERRVGCVGVPG